MSRQWHYANLFLSMVGGTEHVVSLVGCHDARGATLVQACSLLGGIRGVAAPQLHGSCTAAAR